MISIFKLFLFFLRRWHKSDNKQQQTLYDLPGEVDGRLIKPSDRYGLYPVYYEHHRKKHTYNLTCETCPKETVLWVKIEPIQNVML